MVDIAILPKDIVIFTLTLLKKICIFVVILDRLTQE